MKFNHFFVFSSSAVDGLAQKVADVEIDEQKIHMDIEDQHRAALEQFLTQKKEIGELKAQDFLKVNELGCGNGGVVWRVLHKPSSVTMALKVKISLWWLSLEFTCTVNYK